MKKIFISGAALCTFFLNSLAFADNIMQGPSMNSVDDKESNKNSQLRECEKKPTLKEQDLCQGRVRDVKQKDINKKVKQKNEKVYPSGR